MRRKKTLFITFIAILLTCNSCKENLFDFNLQNIEAEGEWGIPLYNSTIEVKDLINNLDSIKYIQFGEDGTLKFVLEQDANIITFDKIYKIPDKSFDTSGTVSVSKSYANEITIPQVIQFNINTAEFALNAGRFKSGQIAITFGLGNLPISYSATLSTNNIHAENSEPLTLSFSNSQTTQTIHLNEYIISPDNNGDVQISAFITLNLTGLDNPINQVDYTCHLSISDCAIHSVSGRLAAFPYHFEENWGFNLPLDKIHLENIFLNNANITIYGKNSLCHTQATLNSLWFFNAAGNQSSLIPGPVTVESHTSGNQYVLLTDVTSPSIQYNNNMDSIHLNCDFTINPLGIDAGVIYATESSALDLKIKAEMPANMSISDASYKDTIDNSLYQAFEPSSIEFIESLVIRIAITNALPFNLMPSIVFYDSKTLQTYTLNIQQMQIHGSFNNVPVVNEPVYIELNKEIATEIINMDKMIIDFHINTQNQPIEIKDNQFMRVSLGAKVKYSNINL